MDPMGICICTKKRPPSLHYAFSPRRIPDSWCHSPCATEKRCQVKPQKVGPLGSVFGGSGAQISHPWEDSGKVHG